MLLNAPSIDAVRHASPLEPDHPLLALNQPSTALPARLAQGAAAPTIRRAVVATAKAGASAGVPGIVADVIADAVSGGLAAAAKSVSTAAAAAARARAAGAGYASGTASATKATTTKKPTKSATTAKSTAAKSTATSSSLAFLNDPKISLEDKLMLLLAQLNAQYEKQMQEHMGKLAGGAGSSATAGSGGSKKKSGSFLTGLVEGVANVVKTVVPGADAIADVLGNKQVQALLGKVGGPVLGAAASALGFPALAPALIQYAPQIASAVGAVAKEVGSAPGSATGALSEGDKQLELMQIQRAQEKQREMFSLVSNILRSMHETRSGIVGNIR
jgi:hypothetical protein